MRWSSHAMRLHQSWVSYYQPKDDWTGPKCAGWKAPGVSGAKLKDLKSICEQAIIAPKRHPQVAAWYRSRHWLWSQLVQPCHWGPYSGCRSTTHQLVPSRLLRGVWRISLQYCLMWILIPVDCSLALIIEQVPLAAITQMAQQRFAWTWYLVFVSSGQ